MNSKLMALAGMLILAGGAAAVAAEGARTGTVLLTLVEGVAPAEPGGRYTRDMELELTLRDGKFEPKVWGYAVDVQKCFHEGQVVGADGEKLTIKMTINRDAFMLRSYIDPLGEADYEITLQRSGDEYAGTFTGKVSTKSGGVPKPPPTKAVDDPKLKEFLSDLTRDTPKPVTPPVEMHTREVKGRAIGKVYPLWTEPRPGFKKLEPLEHPRLIFRKGDLPLIKQRLQTPEGKAIMARFLEQLPRQHATDSDKNKPYFPAGYGLAYQLTGDKAHAEKAKELLAEMLILSGAQDIHFAPEAQAMAVTLDLCYDAWDAKFRQEVIDNLARRMDRLEKLIAMGGASLNPWHNHEAIRACGAGMAAICLLGEKTGDGKKIAGVERIIHVNALSTRKFFQTNGNTSTGWGMEGSFYKRMTWNCGPGYLAQAYRSALGGELLAGWHGQWCVLGEWMWQPPSDNIATAFDLGDHQSAGLWPVGLATIPDSMKAGARWLYDHAFGMEGNKTFGIQWAYHAGYVLMNYPFDVPAKPPGESLPWIAPDPTGGHWLLRKPWQGAKDTLIVLNPHSDNPGGTHWIVGKSWDMQLFALGKLWIGDRVMGEKSDGPGAALPTAADPNAFNDNLSARLTGWSSTPDGMAALSWDMSPIYMQQPQSPVAKEAPKSTSLTDESWATEVGPAKKLEKPNRVVSAPGQKLVKMNRGGGFIDHGIRANRTMAVDLTGACGAPVLLVVIDQTQGAMDLTWNLKLAREAGKAKVEGNTITVGETTGANLRCTFLAPKTPTLTGNISATGANDYFAVITVQNGAAPAVKTEGEGLKTKVTVGSQSFRFDGTRIVWEK